MITSTLSYITGEKKVSSFGDRKTVDRLWPGHYSGEIVGSVILLSVLEMHHFLINRLKFLFTSIMELFL